MVVLELYVRVCRKRRRRGEMTEYRYIVGERLDMIDVER